MEVHAGLMGFWLLQYRGTGHCSCIVNFGVRMLIRGATGNNVVLGLRNTLNEDQSEDDDSDNRSEMLAN